MGNCIKCYYKRVDAEIANIAYRLTADTHGKVKMSRGLSPSTIFVLKILVQTCTLCTVGKNALFTLNLKSKFII